MENFRAPSEESLKPGESNSDRLKYEIIDLLRKNGHTKDIQIKINRWLKMKGILDIQKENDLIGYVNLKIEEVNFYIDAGLKERARSTLEDLILVAENNHYHDLDTLYSISYHIDNMI